MDISKFHFADKSNQQVLLTVTPNTLLIDTIQQMSQAQSSFVLIVEQQQLIGIFTERDVLQAMSNIKRTDSHENNNTLLFKG